MTKKYVKPPWVPDHLSKTWGGQPVGYKPLTCESKGGSDYCYHCSRDMGIGGPCSGLERLRLAMIPKELVVSFSCNFELGCIRNGFQYDADEVCSEWCNGVDCPVTLKPEPEAPKTSAEVNKEIVAAAREIAAEFKALEAQRFDPYSDVFVNPYDKTKIIENSIGVKLSLLRKLVAAVDQLTVIG